VNARVGCVVLAAGGGTRFGADQPKQLLPIHGAPLLQHAIDAAARSHASTCTLVVGANAERVLEGVDSRRLCAIVNEEWKSGIASSIRAGLAMHANDDACIFMVGDQPFLAAADLDHLIERFTENRAQIVALRARSVWGSPVLFPRSDFAALANLRGDAGAKRHAGAHKERISFVPALDARAFVDVDAPEEYERLVNA
jgi:molybdenum cofactor cytidylyltransferase